MMRLDMQRILADALGLHQSGKLSDAEALYRCASIVEPGHADVWHLLGVLALQAGDVDKADKLIRRALETTPTNYEYHYNFAQALLAAEKIQSAVRPLMSAIVLRPDHHKSYYEVGTTLRSAGEISQATDCLERAVYLLPTSAVYYRALATVITLSRGKPHLAAMEKLRASQMVLADHDLVELHFALGEMYGKAGNADKAFANFVAGNALRRRQFTYDESEVFGFFDRIEASFTAVRIAAAAKHGNPTKLPVFIVGMPRSGTSLVEQILASHPRIFGAGERPDFPIFTSELERAHGKFPEIVGRLSAGAYQDLGQAYLEKLRSEGEGADRIVDKMPSNFRLVGFIHMVFPNARIIHCRRDPVDTCLSCFSVLFSERQAFAYDLAELGRYYRRYDQLMAHWKSVLPQGVMLDVQYEDVVADFESQARRLVAHCGLEWDNACLSFHRTDRPVTTASAVQVRQPIYKTSVKRWEPYAPYLGPLFDALEGR